MTYEKKDFYHRKAKEEGFLARSAYKLQEIQKKFSIIHRSNHILDLGCAPGAWVQVALPLVGKDGVVVGIDLENITVLKHDNFRFIHGDAFALKEGEIPEAPFQTVLSDMAPKTSGIKLRDHMRSVELCQRALGVCETVLARNGNFVMKIFEGEESKELNAQARAMFKDVKLFRPQSTRQASIEIYLVAKGKK